MFLWIVLQTQASIALNTIHDARIASMGDGGGFSIGLGLVFGDGAQGWSVVLSVNYQVQSVAVSAHLDHQLNFDVTGDINILSVVINSFKCQ